MSVGPDGVETVVWRWFDAVVLDDGSPMVKLWEPSHGEVVAQVRPASTAGKVGARAYLSAGLPGSEWWVAGPVTGDGRDPDVELSEVDKPLTENGLRDSVD